MFCNIASVLSFGHKAYGILAPWAGIEPAPPVLEGGYHCVNPLYSPLDLQGRPGLSHFVFFCYFCKYVPLKKNNTLLAYNV